MTKLSQLFEEVIAEIVPVSEEREAIIEAIKIEEKFGEAKSTNIIDKYEKIIEGLIG